MRNSKSSYWILVILIVSTGLRIWGINHHFPDVNRYFYETEEYPSVQIAMGFGSGDLNPHSFNKPTLYYYVLFFFYGLFYSFGKIIGFFSGVRDFVGFYFYNTWFFYLLGRLLSVIFGVASIYVIYLTGKKVSNYKVGLMAALFLAVTPIHVEFSQQALPDMFGLFLATLSIFFCLSAYLGSELKNLIISSVFAGLAASSKYYYGFVILAPIILIFLQTIRNKDNTGSLLMKISVSLPFFFIAFIIGTPFAILDYKYFLASVSELKQVKSISPMLMQHKDIIPNWWIEHIFQLAKPNVLGIGMLCIAVIGVFLAMMRRNVTDIILLSLIIFFYSFFSFSKWIWSPVHYLLVIIPSILLLGSVFIYDLFSKLKMKKLLQVILLFLIIFPPFIISCIHGHLNSFRDTKYIAKKWIESNILEGSAILMDRFYVPQLSLTKKALKRLTDFRFSQENKLLPSYRRIKSKNKYAYLRDESLTSQGIPYDIYLIYNNNPPDIYEFKKVNKIEYVILSSDAKSVYLNILPLNINKDKMLRFYDSIQKGCSLIKIFRPNRFNLPGPKIEIYRVN